MSFSTLLSDYSLLNMLIRFFLNLAVLFVLVFVIYYRYSKKEEFIFSYILMGVTIFLICSVLGSKDVQMGLALGIFAVFAIIRFRTVPYSVKEISYVFVIIGISVVNSQANIPPYIVGAIFINASIILITFLLEKFLQKNSLSSFKMIYNNIDMLKPAHYQALLKELSSQTGQKIEKVTIDKVNIERGNAEIDIYFKEINKIIPVKDFNQ